MITFACLSPHPPIILPDVGSKADREKVKNTITNLEFLGEKLEKAGPDLIIISSPHPDWGFNVPLFFLAKDFLPASATPKALQAGKGKVEQHLIGGESPAFYFAEGKKLYESISQKSNSQRVALIASGDLSHCLKEDGPYGFQEDGPKFDKSLIDYLTNKDVANILELDNKYPEAGECGLRSFCFMLGILEESRINYQPEILSYEGPFGVGYLVANFKLR